MAEQWQLRHGTTAENDSFTGAASEITIDTTTFGLRVHDGVTAGGHKIYTKTEIDSLIAGIFTSLYPVGSLYFGTQSTCPLATLIPGSTWVLVAQDRSIQGSSTNHVAGTTIDAGLPNITGTFGQTDSQVGTYNAKANGAFYMTGQSRTYMYGRLNTSENKGDLGFDASRSNNIYGKSSTVQPAVYVSNIWKRTA